MRTRPTRASAGFLVRPTSARRIGTNAPMQRMGKAMGRDGEGQPGGERGRVAGADVAPPPCPGRSIF